MLAPILKEAAILRDWQSIYPLDADLRLQAYTRASTLVEELRTQKGNPSLSGFTGQLLNAYRLTSPQGLALMELAESYLRIPDMPTRLELLRDKIATQDWLNEPCRDWLAKDKSLKLKCVAYALVLAKYLLADKGREKSVKPSLLATALCKAFEVGLRLMANQFVAAQNIGKAYARADKFANRRFSFDMLGEAARCESDARRYFENYKNAIKYIGERTKSKNAATPPHQNKHGVSVKLSAIYSRYEVLQKENVLQVLLPRLCELLELCKFYNIGLTIDAEEALRLELSLTLVESVLKSGVCQQWQGLSIVVQAYNKQAPQVVNKLIELAESYDSLLAIRLVKGAYWDSEIKTAQVKGLADFPTYTRKNHSDIAYICLADKLLQAAPLIYPQFATHNVYTAIAVTLLAEKYENPLFEFQHIYGMGEALHKQLAEIYGYPCRVYVPVGRYDDLLPYLMRRMLENGANSSFVYQFGDPHADVRDIVKDPYQILRLSNLTSAADILSGSALFAPERINSRGCDLDNYRELSGVLAARDNFKKHAWVWDQGQKSHLNVHNPSNLKDKVGECGKTDKQALAAMAADLQAGQRAWQAITAQARASVLLAIADLYEAHTPELLALLGREAGKTLEDGIDEIREAVDFCRYYASRSIVANKLSKPHAVVLCISPWNFPLAIFSGQVAAALVSGSSVIAKPAEQTSLIARRAIELMHQAGVPQTVLQGAFVKGSETSRHIIRAGLVDMVVFTGSCATAKAIETSIAASPKPDMPLLAETGGINAMIIDSTALIERAVDDVLVSAYRSAGQRCSALRMLYVQEDIYTRFLDMLCEAAKLLNIGDSWDSHCDVGPVIDAAAQARVNDYISAKQSDVLWQATLPQNNGYFVPPTIIKVNGIQDIGEEVFAPVLHVASFAASHLTQIINDINARGYGLTFGLHSRLKGRCAAIADAINVGNVYINRNQIGAVVGCQPFGGHGLSGTGPKAGGLLYLSAFGQAKDDEAILGTHALLSPDGEENLYRISGDKRILCCGTNKMAILRAAGDAAKIGNEVIIAHKDISAKDFADDSTANIEFLHRAAKKTDLARVDAVIWGGDCNKDLTVLRRKAIATKDEVISFALTDSHQNSHHHVLYREKHICTDTTAIGGNPSLLSKS